MRRTYIAMNSSTGLFSLRGRRAVSSLGPSCSESTTSIGSSGENELDATRRVYSQPIFKQKLPSRQSPTLTHLWWPSYVLSELLAEFSAGFRGPPKSRDEACPYHAHRDGRGAMERNVDNRYVHLSRVVTGSFISIRAFLGGDGRAHLNKHVRLYVRRTNRPVVAYCGLETM